MNNENKKIIDKIRKEIKKAVDYIYTFANSKEEIEWKIRELLLKAYLLEKMRVEPKK